MDLIREYNNKYSSSNNYWGNKPHSLVVNLGKLLDKGSSILDLGCGEGQNAVYLAKKGFLVTAVDVSRVGIEKLNVIAKNKKLNIKTDIVDAVDFVQNASCFDVIICANILQFISSDKIGHFIEKVKDKTKPGGYNTIASFVAENSGQRERAISRGRYLFDRGELYNCYSSWQIIRYSEKMSSWETHGEAKHRHFVVKLIARKPDVDLTL